MRKYEIEEEEYMFSLIVGTDREIRSLYKNLEKHGFYPVFSGTPKFRSGGMYGITIDKGQYQVVNSDTVVRFLINIKQGVIRMHEGNWGDIIAAIEEYKNNK